MLNLSWWVLVLIVFLAVLGVLVIFWVGHVLLQERRGRAGGDGMASWRGASARWAKPKDVKHLALTQGQPTPGRIRLGWLGNILVGARQNRSVLVMAPSGSGKTPRVLVPAVNNHAGPAVVGSVKTDAYWLTHEMREQAARARRGQVFVFDPTNFSGLASCRWSPLLGVEDYAGATRAADVLVATARPIDSRGMSGQEFWDSQGRQFVAPLLFAAVKSGSSITDVLMWMNMTGGDEYVTDLLEQIGEPTALAAWNNMLASEPRFLTSVRATAKSIMEIWGRPEIASTVDISPEAPLPLLDLDRLLDDSDSTLYLVAPASEQQTYTPIYETLVNAVLKRFEARAQTVGVPPARPLLLAIDEAAQIAPLRRLDEVLSKAAGEGVMPMLVWQSVSQIQKIYGRAAASTVLANTWAKMYLPGINDPETLRAITDAVGTDMYASRSRNRSASGSSVSVSYRAEQVAPAWWIRALGENQAIAVCGSLPAMRLKIPAWFEDDFLRSQVDGQAAELFDSYYQPPAQGKTRRVS
jgi:type IV secretion system protein VirD4